MCDLAEGADISLITASMVNENEVSLLGSRHKLMLHSIAAFGSHKYTFQYFMHLLHAGILSGKIYTLTNLGTAISQVKRHWLELSNLTNFPFVYKQYCQRSNI